VALHFGAAIAMLAGLAPDLADLDGNQLRLIALASLPAGVIGLTLEQRIEARLGTPRGIAVGLILGGLALALSDRCPQERRASEARLLDASWIGLAQASALIPGVSRNGATLAAARFRRFHRADANHLSRRLALPVITGATLLKAWRLGQRPELRRHIVQLAAGAGASFLSARLSATLLDDAAQRPLAGFAAYRVGLAGLILIRLRRGSRAGR
jgi:undecaprenyl-diphosphatase